MLEHDDNGTLAMGLVRGVRLRIPCDNRLWMEYPGDESAQSLRGFSYRYALLAHTGLWNQAGLYREALAFNAPMRVCQFGRQHGIFPLQKSFLEIAGKNLVLSCVKEAQGRDSVIVRLYNPAESDTDAAVSFGFDFKEAFLVNLNEERLEPLKAEAGGVRFTAGKGKIVTIEVV